MRASKQRRFEGFDNLVLVGFGEEGVHGQAEDFAGGFFGFRKVAPPAAAPGEHRLFVQTFGVINRSGYAAGFELLRHLVAVRDSDGVLGIDVGVAGDNHRRRAGSREQGGVTSADAATCLDLRLKMRHFGQEHGGLQGVKAAVHAKERVVVTLHATMGANGSHLLRQGVLAGEQGAAIAIATQWLRWEETGAPYGGYAGTSAPALGGAKALGRVLNHWQTVLRSNGVDAVVIRHLAEEAHGENGFGTRRDGTLEHSHVDVVSARVDINEHGFGANQANDFRAADPGEGHGDHFIPGADPQGPQGNLQAHGATGHGNAVPDAHIFGEHILQFSHLRAHDELAVFENLLQSRLDLILVSLELVL